MHRYRGHFYNWYDLPTLRILEPAYISTVDSGNLAGHLIALAHACLTLPDRPIFGPGHWHTLETGVGLARDRLRAVVPEHPEAAGPLADIEAAAEKLHAAGRSQTASLADLLEPVRLRLEQAAAALEHDATPQPVRAAGSQWIDWSLRLVGRYGAADSGPVLRPTVGRGGQPSRSSESLRERAAGSPAAANLVARLQVLAERAYQYAMDMDFAFLYDENRSLLAIGYQPGAPGLDGSHYDLLASEARLASYVAVAKGDVPLEHWFRLGRTVTRAAGETALVSWSGSMFEYLMPALVMRLIPYTVLEQTARAAVRRQIAHGAEHGVPWGVSESAFNLRDRHGTYQYRAFGVPDLALKRGLGRDLVVAPYATALAAMVEPQRALSNLASLEQRGALGPYGFHDALDYTRPGNGQRYAVVENYMAHHIGMTLVSLTNALTAEVWPRRFHADPMMRSVELLLQERVPRRYELQAPQTARAEEAFPEAEVERPAVRELDTPDTPQPHVALLGHLPYTVMVSHCGAGYSRYEELAVTRWRADGTRDHTGQFCYLRDTAGGRVWSAAHQPTCAPADEFRTFLATDRVTFQRVDGEIETRTEVVTVPADAAEVRRVTLTNHGTTAREVELTSYGEIVLAPPDADRAHPAFGNLFVETEWHDWCTAISATRRPRSAEEQPVWCVHVVDSGPRRVGRVTCETDRARFVGRGRSPRNPVALERAGDLSNTTGAVLDPIFAIRTRVQLEPRESASVAFTTLIASTPERAFELADRYHDGHAAQRALDLAWTSAQVELRELNVTPSEAAIFQEIAGHLFYSNPALRPPEAELLANRGSQPLLWAIGVSGEWPILLATIEAMDGLPTLRQLLLAHYYWRRRGMMVDLVVLNMHPPSYHQDLEHAITTTIHTSSEAGLVDQPGGVFGRRRDLLAPDVLAMLRATARVHVACDGRSLEHLVRRAAEREAGEMLPAEAAPPRSSGLSSPPGLLTLLRVRALATARRLLYDARAPEEPEPDGTPGAAGPGDRRPTPGAVLSNGFGRLTAEGDYEIRLAGERVPPAPWVNVVANRRAGFVVSERGTGFTWNESSYFYRLTPWHNDPVSDPPGETIYLRDEANGEVWSATPAPVPGEGEYVVRHGAGASSFAHEHGGIETRLVLGMAGEDPVKLSLLRVTNTSDRTRKLTVTAYAEWVLGVLREHTQHQVRTTFDPAHRAILARNSFDPAFAGHLAFCASSEPLSGYTADRREFLGRNGSLEYPAGIDMALEGTTGSGDPCAVLRSDLELAPGASRELAIVLGAAETEAEARRLLAEYGEVGRARAAIAESVERWRERLSVVTVRTPERSFDAMLNRWTLYQALACRMWGRSAVYQSSGAYGFRDQLQDVMAFVHAEPLVAREHIVRAAGRQFVEGDVQHWWHPQTGRGVRTRFSDDLAWLPYVVEHYVRVTGDASVLDEPVAFLAMRPLQPHEHEVYDTPGVSDQLAPVYEHCLRALRKACTAGEHGLPLIGTGDWNDGMNRVGVEGRGESVWLAWFLVATLRRFAVVCERRGDRERAAELRARADEYVMAVEAHGWDGEWYRRAFFDDGTPLGSASNQECRIDSIAQSWAVISAAAAPGRAARAMRSHDELLVREDAGLLLLLTPPFDRTPLDPGYIKGYVPGVRENGAQYTHAALWAVIATALRGEFDRAFELFQMINPLTRTATPEGVAAYRVEPYVVAADVYSVAGQVGRGGWTWYTGSASWMYRAGLETILGFTREGDSLTIHPRVPSSWPEYSIEYRYGTSVYVVRVLNPARAQPGAQAITLDDRALEGERIPLADDGQRHSVTVRPIPH
jgi:cyclic beta-1,2-glucan synthetase